MELDFWIPTHDLCFEFQDAYHYVSSWFYQSPKTKIQQKDSWKKTKAQQNSINLVIIPCWWDGTVESLCSAINFQRPDLFDEGEQPPIPLNPLKGFFSSGEIPGVGELMLASFPDDVKNYHSSRVQWWMGEKYDGIRVCWNPDQRRLYMRSGNHIEMLSRMGELMPSVFIDGELWFGRDNFSLTSDLLQSSHNVSWQLLRLLSFDEPSKMNHDKPFEHRYRLLYSSLIVDHPFIIAAWRVLCVNNSHISIFLQKIVDSNGEGVILRQRGSLYFHGRSKALVKMKVTNFNQEGIVIELGMEKEGPRSVFLRLANGSVIKVAGSKVMIPTPTVGTIVTFTFERHALFDIPVLPSIIRSRFDVSWQDIVFNHFKEKSVVKENDIKRKEKVIGAHEKKKMRREVEQIIKERGMDPLLAQTWYSFPFKSLDHLSIGKDLKNHFGGNHFVALQQLFPEVSLNKNIFFAMRNTHLREVRRHFFEKYAKVNHFDPLIASNWYSQSKKQILATEGASKILGYHEGSISKALLTLFPEVMWDKHLLQGLASWNSAESRRLFFEEYALLNKFDPLVATNWYTHSRKKILATPGAKEVISYHDNSVSRALLGLFPNVKLNISTLQQLSSWRSIRNRRQFFENYAKENGFDYLNASHWYSQPRNKIISVEGARKVLLHHNGSVGQALLDLFPDVDFDAKSLHKLSHWNSKENRRAFFEKYAKDHDFDPLVPSNWYSHPIKRIMSQKGGRSVMMHHDNSPIKALIDLFSEIELDPQKLKG